VSCIIFRSKWGCFHKYH